VVVVLTVVFRSPNVAEKHVRRHPGGRVAAQRTSHRPTESERSPAALNWSNRREEEMNEQSCRDQSYTDEFDLKELRSKLINEKKINLVKIAQKRT